MAKTNSISNATSTLLVNDAYILPTADGSSGQVIATDGGGTASWQNPSDGLYEEVVAATKAMVANTAYGANNAAGVVFTLPVTAAAGTILSITGIDGTWSIAQNASQTIFAGNTNTSPGITGSLTADDKGDCIQLRCIVADLSFRVEYIYGNLTIA